MKPFCIVTLFILLVSLASCNFGDSLPTATTTYNYIYESREDESSDLSEESESLPLETESVVSEILTSQEETTGNEVVATFPVEETTSKTEKVTEEESVTQQESSSIAEETEISTAEATSYDITLNVSVPEANGTMQVDVSASNKFIQTVVKERKLDAASLVAVYSVPESGQNYVFEFSESGVKNRTADKLRRVYLIDSDGKITYVAASDASEAENVSGVENWFCMNVLIKGIIFPATEEQMK